MPKVRTPAQQARFEKIQARMGKKVSSTAKAVSPAKAKPTKKRASTPKPTPKKKRTSLSQAKTPEERTAIINARMGKTPEATKKQRTPASSRKKKERAVSKKAASKKKKPSRAKVYQNPEDSEEDIEHVEKSLYDSGEEGKGYRQHNSDIEGSDVEEEIVERTTTKITTTRRKKKGSKSSTRRTTSDSTKRTVGRRGSFLVNANIFLTVAVVACAFYFCMPIIRNNLLLPASDDFQVLELTKAQVDNDPILIMQAYRKRAKALHPDTGTGDDNEFVRVVEAYQRLKEEYAPKIRETKKASKTKSGEISTIAYTPVGKDVQLRVNAIKRHQDLKNIGMGAVIGFFVALGASTMT